MRQYIPIILTFLSTISFSQSDSLKPAVDTTRVYEFYEVDSVPEYPGGVEELMRFFQSNYSHPEMSREMGIFPRVYTCFTIDKNGNVIDIEFIKKNGPEEIYDEYRRVLSLMPKWKPAELSGVRVKTIFYFSPILCFR